MKKIICALLIGMSIFSFTACSDDKVSDKEADTENTAEESTVAEDENDEDEIFNFDDSSTEDTVQITDMAGKKFSEVLDEGYEYIGYAGSIDEYYFYVTSENADDDTLAKIAELEGKTVGDLIEKDLSIGYSGWEADYTYSATLGSVEVNFDIDGADEIVEKYTQEDTFTDIEDMEELYDMPISNVELSYVEYTIVFEEPVSEVSDDAEEQIKDYTIKEFYYNPVPEI